MQGSQLIFDPTDADTMEASSNVGAYLRSPAGVLFTETNNGGKRSLDVNISNTAVAVSDGGGSITVDGTVAISGTVAVTQSTSPWVIGDGGGSITVDAVNLDIRDLAAATDTVAAWTKDGSGNSINSTSNALHVFQTNAADTVNSSFKDATTAVDDSAAVPIPATSLANRKRLIVQNAGPNGVFLGGSTVTSATGFELLTKGSYAVEAGPLAILYGRCATGKTADVKSLEAA